MRENERAGEINRTKMAMWQNPAHCVTINGQFFGCFGRILGRWVVFLMLPSAVLCVMESTGLAKKERKYCGYLLILIYFPTLPGSAGACFLLVWMLPVGCSVGNPIMMGA